MSEALADIADEPGRGLLDRRGLREDPRDYVAQTEAPLRRIALRRLPALVDLCGRQPPEGPESLALALVQLAGFAIDDAQSADARALAAAGFIYRRVASLGQPGGLDLFLDGANASARDAVHIVFAAEKVRPESSEPSPDISESEAADQFRVLSLEALVRMKLTAFRDKDRTHLRDLIEIGLLKPSILERLSAELRSRMQLLFDTPEG